MEYIYQNKQVKKSIIFIMVIIILILSIGYISSSIINIKIANYIRNEEAALIGEVYSIDEKVGEEVVSTITKGKIVDNDIEKGKELLKNYGYSEYEVKDKNSDIVIYINVTIAIIMFLLVCILIVKEIFTYKEFFKPIERINTIVEKIIDGNREIRLVENDEGQFYRLSSNINSLTRILNNAAIMLKKEKEFLKNLISDISHQLKTPLTTLIIYNDLLVDDIIGDDKKKEIFETSRVVLSKMQWLIINLLKLATLESSALEFKKENCIIKDVVIESINKLKAKINEKNVTIDLAMDNESLILDKGWTEEALINVIKNAIEHSNYNGEIKIHSENTLVYYKLIVEDFGEGIDEKDIINVFKRFYKGKSSSKDSIGIGLALCKSIIEGQGGKVAIESKKGYGTKFIFTFIKV
ncbi:sensor signal transduction histidine kinase [Clostridium bornimense]|uniref:histidine kinase n=1 Tax=Clostridium bornimense TaxID=1216932 RepID=W6S175_9CLOT|nr:HAMP domain-containing sensor histidine kinase [Clostridium bornimense]CDM69624.1 sensor signal transduction histidine kinase [Clostridium bornimense]